MCYLKLRHNSRLAFDPSYPDTDHINFQVVIGQISMRVQWKLSHPMFIDSNHAGDKWTRISRTRFMVFMNTSLINWCPKEQSTIETLVVGSEYVAMKVGIKTLCAFWHMLRMMGIPISGASYVYGDKMPVFNNT